MKKIKVGIIGMGYIGESHIEAVRRIGCCQLYAVADTNTELAKAKAEMYGVEKYYSSVSDLLADPEIDAVVIMIGWSGRPQMAMEAMRAGKYTAIEVGTADTLEECYELVRTYEETGVPLMMLENCCYGRREMMALNLAKQGLLGEIMHCTGGYHHYLNDVELFLEVKDDAVAHYRLAHYREKNRENYPTHELGPIAKLLGINRGNRMLTLTSVASGARGIQSYAEEHFGADSALACEYRQGDIVNTLITCASGATVLLTLDTTLPRAYYSRNFSARGTKGMTDEARRVVFFEGMKEEIENNEAEMYEKYDHPLHAEYVKIGERGGHGGMDWLVCRAFVESVKNQTNTPIDAYDTAAWMAIGPLSERSIAAGGAPVEIPDFTNGKWQNREPIVEGKYCLDAIICDESTEIV